VCLSSRCRRFLWGLVDERGNEDLVEATVRGL
jgi:hypothetical protein